MAKTGYKLLLRFPPGSSLPDVLKASADTHGRSLTQEIIARLEQSVAADAGKGKGLTFVQTAMAASKGKASPDVEQRFVALEERLTDLTATVAELAKSKE